MPTFDVFGVPSMSFERVPSDATIESPFVFSVTRILPSGRGAIANG
jgi:hypothetical protein